MWSVVLWAIAFIIVYVTQWIYRWRNPNCKGGGILPPGSSGFPLIGESIQMIGPYYSLGTLPFITDRVKKYGPLFRTNFAGRQLIISTDVQTNNIIFQLDEHLVEPWYIHSFDKLLNATILNEIHKHMRGLVLRQMGCDNLKQNLLPRFEELASTTFQHWSTRDSILVNSATSKAFVEMGAKAIYSFDLTKSEELGDKFTNLLKLSISFPLNIPGSKYHKFTKNREELAKMFSDTVGARLISSENREGDLLDLLIQEMERDKTLTKDIAGGLIFALTLAASEGPAFVFALALNFISENPSVLRELVAEHEKILDQREDSRRSSSISWDDYKSMSFTHQVIKETLRMGSTIPGIFRMVKKDFVLNGYTIPKDWAIAAYSQYSHFDPTLLENPHEFNPWRWKGYMQDFKSDVSNNFNPFGGGTRQCAGADYTKAIISIFLHVLVTKYRWEKIGGGDIVQNPVAQFKTDVRIKVAKKKRD